MTDSRLDRSGDDDLASAVLQVDLPITVVDLRTDRVLGISTPALELLGLTAPEVIGRRVADVASVSERQSIELALEAIRHGRVGFLVGEAMIQRPGGGEQRLLHWTHAFDVGDRRVVLVQTAPSAHGDVSPLGRRLGREPVRMAVGVLDEEDVVTAVSTDTRDLFGLEPADFVGRELFDETARRDLRSHRPSSGELDSYSLALGVDLPVASSSPKRAVVVLPALAGDPSRAFVLVAEPATRAAAIARVAELEYWLGQIGTIVLASGTLQRIGSMPDLAGHPEVSRLSRRQWEVLSRVVEGDSVADIAEALFVSPSTVRNHLSAIYAHFGVHSRVELQAYLRKPRPVLSS